MVFRSLASTLAFAGALAAGQARADWRVYDQRVQQDTSAIKKSSSAIQSNTQSIKEQLQIGSANDKWPGTRPDDPDSKFPASSGGAQIKLDDGQHCNTIAKAQQDTCNKIVEIENAQYKFMVVMYETSKARDTTLREILAERQGLSPTDYGKLEDNTNKLTALQALIALDRQQMESVNFAYEANLRYLRALQTQAANVAAKGGKPGKYGSFDLPIIGSIDVGNLLNAAIGGATLAAGLEKAKTTSADGMLTLGVTKGF